MVSKKKLWGLLVAVFVAGFFSAQGCSCLYYRNKSVWISDRKEDAPWSPL